MAKDKSKTKDKGEKKAKGAAANDEFARPSDAPASGGDGFKFESDEHIGELFLITPIREETAKGFEGEDTKVIVADIVALNEKKAAKSEAHEEVYVFGGWTKGALRGYIGERRVLARLARDKSKGRGGNAAWVLEDGDDDDIAVAKEYLASLDPFDAPKKKDKK